MLMALQIGLLSLAWVIILLIGIYLWRTKQYLWTAYDKLEDAVHRLSPVLDDLEREQLEELFKEIEKHLRES